MAHPQQMAFVAHLKDRFPQYFKAQKVLEVGSLNLNGTIRSFFEQCMYLGVDVGPGPGVDMVAKGEDLTFDAGQFDVVCSTECFEHAPRWADIFNNMTRMSKGLVFFTCATTGRPEHGTKRSNPWDSPHTAGDYYMNVTEADVREKCDLSQFEDFGFQVDDEAHDLYFWGIKSGSLPPKEN